MRGSLSLCKESSREISDYMLAEESQAWSPFMGSERKESLTAILSTSEVQRPADVYLFYGLKP